MHVLGQTHPGSHYCIWSDLRGHTVAAIDLPADASGKIQVM